MRKETTVEVSQDVIQGARKAAAILKAMMAERPAATALTISMADTAELARMLENHATMMGKLAALVDQASALLVSNKKTLDALIAVNGIAVQRKTPSNWWKRLFS